MARRIVILGLLAAALVPLLPVLHPYWYEREPARRPEYGVNFSCRHAAWLGLDCRETYLAILDDLQVKHLRLSVYWSDVEPSPGRYDFEHLDWLLDEAAERDVQVLLTVGVKAQRYPEFYPPEWLVSAAEVPARFTFAEDAEVEARALALVRHTVEHYAHHPAVAAWQVENEPYLPNIGPEKGWSVGRDLVLREIQVVRETDPLGRPVVVNHASHHRFDPYWRDILATADVLAQNVYTRKPFPLSWLGGLYVSPYRLGPFTADLSRQARAADQAGKALWITELQAEPWERADVRLLRQEQIGSIDLRRLEENLRLAANSGATRVYLWGAEWWYYQLEAFGDDRWWQAAREIFAEEIDAATRLDTWPLPARPGPAGGVA
ncbi:MAG TPA: beta-galactosidase [Dehalococcoidia bacterium]